MKCFFRLSAFLALLAFVSTSTGCIYSSVAIHGDKAIIAKATFGGLERNLYVCDVTPEGITNCHEKDVP
jgi:hypothetical protein